ncbi:MAG: substrate-binding domain-containing protein [Elusimicrobia bacterium]|nr:substrate-binding domain-containing protein [Candidatus Liberimonas magnetica]
MKKTIVFFVCSLAMVFSVQSVQDVIRMYGATTVVEFLGPYKNIVEKNLECRLEIVGNAAGVGLMNLDQGKCDVALTATTLENTLNAARMGKRDISSNGLVFTSLKNDELVFILNKSNPVTNLTKEQLKKILIGSITNWREVGGPNLTIAVIAGKPTCAIRNLIRKELFPEADFSPRTKEFTLYDALVAEVESTPGAIAGVSRTYVTPDVKIVDSVKLSRPLAFITKDDSQGKVKKVIEEFKKAVSETEKPAEQKQ